MDGFQDWEVLHSSSDSESPTVNSTDSVNPFDEIDSSELVQVNYFSLDAQNRGSSEEDLGDDNSIESDNPSWIDPGLEENPNRYLHKDSGEFWSDSSSERSEDRKLEGSDESFISEKGKKTEVGFEGIGEIAQQKGETIEGSGKFYSGSSGSVVESVKFGDFVENSENGNKRSDETEKKFVMWWKMVKYCVFRMSPVWSISVAAAVMGFVILGRRLYQMKKKIRGLEVKVTVDDKKISQVISRVARLNEAFSVVKRVPVIRPSLPTVGVATWPALNLR